MNLNFSFNFYEYDCWEIYEAIKQYYPIGIIRGEGRGIYFEYPGIKELEEIVMEKIHDNKNYNKRWIDFTNEIEKELNLEVYDTTFGQAPSFSSTVILERNKMATCMHSKEVHFSVSLIGNFFQIYGVDSTRIFEKSIKKAYTAVNVLTTSPYEEMKASFEVIELKLKERYPSYRLIPFAIGQTIINGLQVRYSDDEICSVNMALFNSFTKVENSTFTRGDRYYGIDQWKKKG